MTSPLHRSCLKCVGCFSLTSTKNGAGLNEWMAKSSASAATVFSPPLSSLMARKRFIGGIAVYLMPAHKHNKKGSKEVETKET